MNLLNAYNNYRNQLFETVSNDYSTDDLINKTENIFNNIFFARFKDAVPEDVIKRFKKEECVVEGNEMHILDLEKIPEAAFLNCYSLISLKIPDSVTTISAGAFAGCTGLSSINIPDSVISMDYSAFDSCSRLESIIVDSNNTVYDSRNNCNAIIETSINELIQGCKNTVIPDSVTSIGELAFCSCRESNFIEIPDSVKYIGKYTFWDCSGLTSVYYKGIKYTLKNEIISVLKSNGVTVDGKSFDKTGLS